jgi:TPR repeat protein
MIIRVHAFMSTYSEFEEFSNISFYEKALTGEVGSSSPAYLAELCFGIAAFYEFGSMHALVFELSEFADDIKRLAYGKNSAGEQAFLHSFQRHLEAKYCGGLPSAQMDDSQRRMLMFRGLSEQSFPRSECMRAASQWYERAISHGHVHAHVRMFNILQDYAGNPGDVRGDPAGDALWHLRQACLKGSLYARGCLAFANLPREEAFYWLEKAARDGHDIGCFNYAFRLREQGCLEEAQEFLLKATEKEHPGACRLLGYIFEYGELGQADYLAALAWYRRAAELGDQTGAANLANLLAHERYGVGVDLDEAQKWNHLASVMDPASRRAAQFEGAEWARNLYMLLGKNETRLESMMSPGRFAHAAAEAESFLAANQGRWKAAYRARHECRDLAS